LIPPLGFLFDLRSLNLTVVLAVAFFFAGAMLIVGVTFFVEPPLSD